MDYEKTQEPEEKYMRLLEGVEREYRSRVQDYGETTEMELLYREEEARREVVIDQILSQDVIEVLLELGNYDHIKYAQVV